MNKKLKTEKYKNWLKKDDYTYVKENKNGVIFVTLNHFPVNKYYDLDK